MKHFLAVAACLAASSTCHAAPLPHLPLHANITMPGASVWHFSDQDALSDIEQIPPTIEAGVLGFGMIAPCEHCVEALSERGTTPTVQFVAVSIHF